MKFKYLKAALKFLSMLSIMYVMYNMTFHICKQSVIPLTSSMYTNFFLISNAHHKFFTFFNNKGVLTCA